MNARFPSMRRWNRGLICGAAVHRAKWPLRFLASLAIVFGPSPGYAQDIDVTVQTTGCSGESGFASFPSSRLHKIADGWCSDPDNPGKKLQQVFLKSDSGPANYDVLWVTQDEARSIFDQIKEIRDAELEEKRRPDFVIERETVVRQDTKTPPADEQVTRGDAPAPEIHIIDPPLGNVRTATNIITPTSANSRLIVGRVEAPAGLLSLSVNGRSSQVDAEGLFRSEVMLQAGETLLSIVAVAKDGQSRQVELRLITELPQVAADSTGDQDIFGAYYALIIANNSYTSLDNLNTPINDADEIASILANKFGFTVTKLYDASRYEVLTALNGLRRDLTDRDNLLIYYAGHGEYDKVNNRGHWLPVDAERDSTANWIATTAITDTLNAMSTKHVLVVADSCYSGSLTRSALTQLDPGMSENARNEWLRTIAATRSRYVLTSGGVKPVLDDSGNGHSVFATALIDVLRQSDGVLEGTRLYREVRDRVEIRARELDVDQIPQYSPLKQTGHEYGEFLLVNK